ncbi:MAG: hypothetical protein KGI42_14900 [Xanthomonadaceae bacterium]|nr:hypothetical protein [Xanthomonadaceae bacterium]
MSKLVLHPYFQGPRLNLQQALEKEGTGKLIFVIGATAVGKTTMRRLVMRNVVGNPELWGQGLIPAIEVMAQRAKGAHFDSKHLVNLIFEELYAPRLTWLSAPGEGEKALKRFDSELERSRNFWRNGYVRDEVEATRWRRVGNMIEARGTWIVCIDEATALSKNHGDTDAADHIENLKAFAEQYRTNVLFCGGESASALWACRPKIRHRAKIIIMPTYSDKRRQDCESFLRILQNMEQRYLVSKQGLLTELAPELLAACAGSIGVLKKILDDATDSCALTGDGAIDKSDIRGAYYSEDALKELWKEVREFDGMAKEAFIEERSREIAARWNIRGLESQGDGNSASKRIKGSDS